MLHVAHQPDDLADLFSVIVSGKLRLDPFPDHVLSGEIFLREALVYDHDRSGVEPITLIEDTALPDRDAHRLEIIRRDDVDGGDRSLAFGQGTLFDVERSHQVAPAQGQRHDGARRFDTGNGADARQKLIEECDDVFVFRIGGARQRDARGEEPLGAQAWLDAAESRETLDQKSGRDQQDHSERDFGHDESIANAAFVFPTAANPGAGLERAVEIDVRRLPRGDKAKDNTGRERDEQSEYEHGSVELDVADARNILRHGLDQGFGSPLREKQSEDAA